jgi:uncharacterized protein (TIGR03067 family)
MWRALIVSAAVGAMAADAKEDANKKDLQALEGTWSVQSWTQNGTDEAGIDGVRLAIAGSRMTAHGFPQEKKATITLDAASKPAAMDLKDEDEATVSKWIYRIDGDTLKLCGRLSGGKRPDEFASPKGSKAILIVLRREKR